MNKENTIEILNELFDKVQDMRETGDSDLRTVLHLINEATKKVELSD